MRDRCGNCGLAIERGERDYFIGSMMFNLAVSETLFAIVFVTTLVITWPNVPWDTLQWAAPLGDARRAVRAVSVLEAGLARLRYSAATRDA